MMKYPRPTGRLAATLFLAAAFLAGPASADPPHGKGKGKGKEPEERWSASEGGSALSVTITFGQARRIAVDMGATRYKPLPPGIRKNLARGKPLPPGIARQLAPSPMLARLPVYPGHEWRIAGADLVLVAVGSAIVVEILANVFE
jgi:hypothetical protein